MPATGNVCVARSKLMLSAVLPAATACRPASEGHGGGSHRIACHSHRDLLACIALQRQRGLLTLLERQRTGRFSDRNRIGAVGRNVVGSSVTVPVPAWSASTLMEYVPVVASTCGSTNAAGAAADRCLRAAVRPPQRDRPEGSGRRHSQADAAGLPPRRT